MNLRRHATPLYVAVAVPAILASASVFTAHDGNNYDPDRFGPGPQYTDGAWIVDGETIGHCPSEDSCDVVWVDDEPTVERIEP